MKKIRISAVSYLNTKPLLYGLLHSPLAPYIDLQLDIPSVCAQKLKAKEVDLGLVPVAILPELDQPKIVSNFCIGTDGAVKTVCIYSQIPMEELTTIYLDFHSRTSVELTKILIKEFWQQPIQLVPSKEGYEKNIKGTTGGLIIGDRAIELANHFKYEYDLGKAWKAHTGLPFVFASWVANTSIADDFLIRFDEALANGIKEIPKLIYLLPSPIPGFSLEDYYTKYINYHFDAAKEKALALFLRKFTGKVEYQLYSPTISNF